MLGLLGKVKSGLGDSDGSDETPGYTGHRSVMSPWLIVCRSEWP